MTFAVGALASATPVGSAAKIGYHFVRGYLMASGLDGALGSALNNGRRFSTTFIENTIGHQAAKLFDFGLTIADLALAWKIGKMSGGRVVAPAAEVLSGAGIGAEGLNAAAQLGLRFVFGVEGSIRVPVRLALAAGISIPAGAHLLFNTMSVEGGGTADTRPPVPDASPTPPPRHATRSGL
jgi:hypothetical protein